MQPIELNILIGLHRAANEIDRRTAKIAKAHGLTLGQFAVLEALFHKGDLSVGEVQEKILSSTGTIPVIVKNLESKGLLLRLEDPRDKRKRVLHLTEEGSALIQTVFPENKTMIIRSMDRLSSDEKSELLRLLKKLGG